MGTCTGYWQSPYMVDGRRPKKFHIHMEYDVVAYVWTIGRAQWLIKK
jgi:hypothetical protein